MQIPILNGQYTDSGNDIRRSYPVNLIPTPVKSGISEGYLRPSEGLSSFSGIAPGIDRGGVNWNGQMYRVMGDYLVHIDSVGNVTNIGTVGTAGSTEQASLDYYSFTYLGVVADKKMYLYDGTTLTQITDADLGDVLDFIWVDGYFMTTDGTNIVVTSLADPFIVDPFQYGSSEVHADDIKAILKVQNEPVVMGRYSIESFVNVGGAGFPFERIDGSQITKGTLGTHTCCVYIDHVVFLGSGEKEEPAIWMSKDGGITKLSTREIDLVLQDYTEAQLADSLMETRTAGSHHYLYLHLPDKTLVYDHTVSQASEQPVWYTLSSGNGTISQYRARNFVWCYDQWNFGDTDTAYTGTFDKDDLSHWGNDVTWQFNTEILYNEGNSAVIHELELVALTGRMNLSDTPQISTRYSTDGQTWSQRRWIKAGTIGDRTKRLVWLQQGPLRQWRIQQFEGLSTSKITPIRLEAQVEGLAV